VILPIKDAVWRVCAEMRCTSYLGLCALRALRYGFLAQGLSSRLLAQTKRGLTCAKQVFLQLWPQYSGYRRATTRWWTNAPKNASAPARLLGHLGPFFWTETRSQAPLSVACLVASPAKTGSFWSKRATAPLTPFISPLLDPHRASDWGFFSRLHDAEPAVIPVLVQSKVQPHV
jgi:hypothetical protein